MVFNLKAKGFTIIYFLLKQRHLRLELNLLDFFDSWKLKCMKCLLPLLSFNFKFVFQTMSVAENYSIFNNTFSRDYQQKKSLVRGIIFGVRRPSFDLLQPQRFMRDSKIRVNILFKVEKKREVLKFLRGVFPSLTLI